MNPFGRKELSCVLLSAFLTALSGPVASAGEPVIDFQRDVRPILSSHCFKCHGPDEQTRQARLRLDERDAALSPARSGQQAIVPGHPEASELVRRIFSSDSGELMPPPETKHPLSAGQKETLRAWISEGAEYSPHWAFLPPNPGPVPAVEESGWTRNPIDQFVLARLEQEELKPSPPADKYELVRRVHLDLIGLPPTPGEAEAFARDPSPEAYEQLVDKLLASPHYGERWARHWLDLARYADTNGYEKDRTRSIWPYRDWVIDALNADMPFDRFTIEQLAGDMLPDPTLDQRIATGFNRNTMLNEEGGIDPLEFRYYAMADRVHTTATTWLGLTMSCAQCHTHKYDPIQHSEYFQFMAFLDNADEPEIDVFQEDIAERRRKAGKQIALLEADLPNRFPPEPAVVWDTPPVLEFTTEGGAQVEPLNDGSHRLSGPSPAKDVYTVVIESDLEEVLQLRLEALADSSLPGSGPGRAHHGNFVLNQFAVSVAPRGQPDQVEPIKLVQAEADFSQNGFPVANAIDGKSGTGWAIHGPGTWNVDRTAIFTLDKPAGFEGGARWTIRLVQRYGSEHTLGRLRLSLGREKPDSRPLEVRRSEHLERKFDEWLETETGRVAAWTVLRPVEAKSNLPLLTLLGDDSVLASGDQTKSDTYTLKFQTDLPGITAFRVEALPDERLPRHGPGRVYYEGPIGDFTLSEFMLSAGGRRLVFTDASHSFASGRFTAQAAIDGNPQTGWSINGGQGRAHNAVFNLAEPLEAGEFTIEMLFERHFAAGLGRFRISATSAPRTVEAVAHPPDIEELFLRGPETWTAADRDRLLGHFVTVAPELAEARQEIEKLRRDMPRFPTTLVMVERPPENPRPTYMYNRGEFLEPMGRVEPAVPSFLHPFPEDQPRNRLNFAKWLVSPESPLVGRVVMNRHWGAFFGHGLVRTSEDFGFQGELPSHPELLDWLALEFINQGWSMKKMHRLIVTSSTYRQSSRVPPELLEKDPENRLLARGPRVRLEGELIRDLALKSSGLLAPKLGGPSVFPPQPPGVTTEGTFGALQWNVSEGADRYRRGLYTFAKRTAPYAMFATFDGPSGESCLPRREVSNTPLQSLILLNDVVFMEAAQALGARIAAREGDDISRMRYLFRRILTRPPEEQEIAVLLEFYETQKRRFASGELDSESVAGPGEGEANERAAWTAVARALLNIDETITKG